MTAVQTLEMDKTICREQFGSTPVKRTYSINIQHDHPSLTVHHFAQNWGSLKQFFRAVFLPQGYPDSVSKDYLQYQIWDTIQAFASSITGTLATQAVLKGAGVGDESATVLGATITWILKDGTGMLGRIIFAWIQSSSLDCDCKRWRLFADILNDCAIFLDILAPYFKESFTVIVCISGLARSIVGVAGGATRAALTQHQARRNNMADVSAKDGSQETLVNLAGLLCSLVLVPMVTGHQSVIWLLFIIFTMLHLYANYSAVTCVSIETFNQSRLHLACRAFFQSGFSRIEAVANINQQEPVVWKLRRLLNISVGVSAEKVFNNADDLNRLSQLYQNEKYLLNINLHKKSVAILLDRDATEYDQMKSCFQAEILEYALLTHSGEMHTKDQAELRNVSHALQQGDSWSALHHSYTLTQMVYPSFRTRCDAHGWNLNIVLLGADEWRAQWSMDGLELKKEF